MLHPVVLPGTLLINGQPNVVAELHVGRKFDEILKVLIHEWSEKETGRLLVYVLHWSISLENDKTTGRQRMCPNNRWAEPQVNCWVWKTQKQFWSKQKVYLEKAHTLLISDNPNVNKTGLLEVRAIQNTVGGKTAYIWIGLDYTQKKKLVKLVSQKLDVIQLSDILDCKSNVTFTSLDANLLRPACGQCKEVEKTNADWIKMLNKGLP